MPGLLAWCVLVALVGGCARKVPTGQTGVGGGVADESLAPGSGSSLDLAREGMAPGEDGALKDVHFPYDSSDLDEVARGTLDENLTWLRDNPNTRVEIEGHCDSRGTIEYNLALGARRARTVQEYLVTQGVPVDRVTTISYGKELPLCQEETEDCWARNRRAHSVVGR